GPAVRPASTGLGPARSLPGPARPRDGRRISRHPDRPRARRRPARPGPTLGLPGPGPVRRRRRGPAGRPPAGLTPHSGRLPGPYGHVRPLPPPEPRPPRGHHGRGSPRLERGQPPVADRPAPAPGRALVGRLPGPDHRRRTPRTFPTGPPQGPDQ